MRELQFGFFSSFKKQLQYAFISEMLHKGVGEDSFLLQSKWKGRYQFIEDSKTVPRCNAFFGFVLTLHIWWWLNNDKKKKKKATHVHGRVRSDVELRAD